LLLFFSHNFGIFYIMAQNYNKKTRNTSLSNII